MQPGRLAVVGLLVIVAAAAVIFGVRVAWAQAAARPQPVAAASRGPGPLVARSVPAGFATGDTAAGQPGSRATAAALPTAASVLLVHVVGQVRHPGVVRLKPGARVADAVDAAGGSTQGADLSEINLARVVADGEQVVVPRPGEQPPPAPGGDAVAAGPRSPGGQAGAPETTAPAAPINLNTADAAALDALPGVGPVLSQRIIEWRTEHGRFSSVDELGEVSGIGDKMLSQLRTKVTV